MPLKGKLWVVGKGEQSAGYGMHKGQLSGIEPQDIRGRGDGMGRSWGIFGIPCDGTACVGHLDADLVVAACVKGDFGKGKAVMAPKDFIMKPCEFCAGGIGRTDVRHIRAAVFDQIILQSGFRTGRDAI